MLDICSASLRFVLLCGFIFFCMGLIPTPSPFGLRCSGLAWLSRRRQLAVPITLSTSGCGELDYRTNE